ncbi:MAG: hypothetical protein O3A63_06740, partial [Proteobacteria bacterium]|nr:hypothetical protein [Pseudomonadota bacterium]
MRKYATIPGHSSIIAGVFAQPLIDRLTRLRAPRDFPLSDFTRVRDAVEPCDVVLIEGRSQISDVIKMITQSPWSHAALSVGTLGEQPDHVQKMLADLHLPAEEQLVIESVLGHGTIVVPLAKYAQDHVRICRPE